MIGGHDRMAFRGAAQTVRLNVFADYLEDRFGEALKRVRWEPIFKVIGLILESNTKLNFDRAQTPDGVPWKPLKRPRHRTSGMGQADASQGEEDRPLRDTGIMMGSVTSQGGQGHYERVVNSLFEWGSVIDRAPFHQWGTATIPKREFLGINDVMLQQIQEVLATEITKQLGGPPGA